MKNLRSAPFGIKYRELWLPEQINALSLPPAIAGGHALTLSAGAAKKTTADGVRFDGTANGYLNCGELYDAGAKLWVSFRLRLAQDYTTGGGNKYLMQKLADATHYLDLYLSTADGKVHLRHKDGGAELYDISVGTGTLAGGTWYNVVASISSVGGVRLRLDNGTAATNADVTALPNGGNLTFANQSTPGTSGFAGSMADIMVGTDDLTTAQEADVYKGIPPATTVNEYCLDEGRGTTAYDLGSGGNNGTLGSTTYWVFNRAVQPVIGFDGIDGLATTSQLRMDRAITFILVDKVKTTYNALSATAGNRFLIAIDEATVSAYLYYQQVTDRQRFFVNALVAAITAKPAIDDYQIHIATITPGGTCAYYLNGALVGSASVAARAGFASTTVRLGKSSTAGTSDPAKHLLDGIAEGAFTAAQALVYSRWINQQMNLGLSI